MTEPLLISRQRDLIRDLHQVAADRARAEPEVNQTLKARRLTIERDYEETYQNVIIRFASDKEAADHAITEGRESAQRRFEEEQSAIDKERLDALTTLRGRYNRDKDALRTAFQETRWTISAELERVKTEAEAKLREDEARVAARMERLLAIQEEARQLLLQWKQRPEVPPPPPDETDKEKLRNLQSCVTEAEEHLAGLHELVLPRWLKGRRLVWIFVFLWLALIWPLAWVASRFLEGSTLTGQLVIGTAASTILNIAAGYLTFTVIWSVARRQVRELYRPLIDAVLGAQASRALILETFADRKKRAVREAKKKHNYEVQHAHDLYRQKRAKLKRRKVRGEKGIEEQYKARCLANSQQLDQEMEAAESHYKRRREEIQNRYEDDSRDVHERRDRLAAELKGWLEQTSAEMTAHWEQSVAKLRATVREISYESRTLFPPWDDPSWQTWTPPATPPDVLRFGEYQVGYRYQANGQRDAEGNGQVLLGDVYLPALCAFPDRYSFLFQTAESGRNEAVAAIQMLMFRLLTSLPPGKVRFTIIDPVGLGQNFAAFMHLADYDEKLVTARIWTETAHIEQRLGDLTAHMENVIQKYLRNQFESISEYNLYAGEVAEPFRVLVVANFPAGFSPEAARRLLSIAQSGQRCGISTLVSVDTRQEMPMGFQLTDLAAHSLILKWRPAAPPDTSGHSTVESGLPNAAGRFHWKDPDFERYPLRLDPPPGDELGNRVLAQIGEKARAAGRVEVPFEFIAPVEAEWWSADSRGGVRVPLGRAGATKRQFLDLGRGTSQHVLVAGKTGSGKSTLWHVLITNLGLLYSPEEVELYLIDFKKGVEFKTYATHEMPHARVIAIESEREFGLSVLQRLDAELKARGDRFREAGTQDLAGYRQARPDVHVPRILLIVDEFQEFFTEDDRISQDAAQLLDRLVRQGRAFGLHVLLGSQTLGGAYSLARSTIDQMAVRIALQCSEADAQLILSDDNSAARLLSRPGEAIYNDANGRVEGNDPFQIVWLTDERKETYLDCIHDLAEKRHYHPSSPPVVFEGNVPAAITKNHLLERALATARGSEPQPKKPVLLAWLGEAIAIKDPTAASFRRQSGANLLVIGQQDDMALGMLTTAIIGLAAQSPEARFVLVDGTPVDATHHGYLARLPEVMSHNVRVGNWRDVPVIMTELSQELTTRQQTPDQEAPPIFVLLYGLQRLRDLRKAEDDFGYMPRGDAPPNPSQQFATLLREGAPLGIHLIVWCDTLTNLQRCLDRQGMREFELRVLFQMSVADSSNLIDSPAASRLGANRGYYHSEEEGRLEKFRPYEVPAEEWLARVRTQLRGAASEG